MLMLAMMMAAGAPDLPPVTPGTCRVAAERFIEMSARVRDRITTTASDADRPNLLTTLDADLAKGNAVLTAYRDVKTTEADGAALNGLRGSQVVDYVKLCADALRISALPPVTPGICKMAALLDLQLLAAVRKSLEADAEAARKGKPHEYEDGVRGRMLAILDGDAAASQALLVRYADSGTPSKAEIDQAGAMSRDDQKLYLKACAA